MTSSTSLQTILANSGSSGSDYHVHCLADLLARSEILPVHTNTRHQLQKKERFQWHLFTELFREMDFFYRQLKKGQSNAPERLKKILLSLAAVSGSINCDLLKRFSDSVGEQEEACWFLVSTLANFPGMSVAFFKANLKDRLLNLAAPNQNVKSALYHSMAVNLLQPVKPLFDRLNPDIRTFVLEILRSRKELDCNHCPI